MGMIKVDASKLSAACRQLAEAARVDAKTVLRNEVAVILKKCAGETKVGTAERADVRSRVNTSKMTRGVIYGSRTAKIAPGQSLINAGYRSAYGRVWYRTKNKKFQPVFNAGFTRGWHISPKDWPTVKRGVDLFRSQIKIAIQRGRASIGLARQSWVQIADNLGIALETVKGGGTLSAAGVAKARAAIASDGQAYMNGQANEFSAASNAVITIINRLPYGRSPKLALDGLLASVVNGRLAFFTKNVEMGMLSSAQRISRAYPGLKVNLPAGSANN